MKFIRDKRWFYGCLTVITAVVIMLLIVLVKKVNVDYVGSTKMTIGLAKINKGVYNSLGENKTMDLASNVILFASLAGALFFVVLGAIQLFDRKKLYKIDNKIKALAFVYVITAWIYVGFEYVLVINRRPTLGELTTSPSFPSTHTMVIVMISLTSITMLEGLIKNKKVLYSIEGAIGLLAVLGIVFRMLSGKHWFTDIIAGILFGLMLYFFHKCLTDLIDKYDEAHPILEE